MISRNALFISIKRQYSDGLMNLAAERAECFVWYLMDMLRNPKRASIFFQLAQNPDSTATEIAKDLNLDVDIVYYHLKLLRKHGFISEPRVVVKKNYLEKFYSIKPSFKDNFLRFLGEFKTKKEKLNLEETREMLIASLTVIHSVIASSARQIETLDAKLLEKLLKKKDFVSKVWFCTREKYDELLDQIKSITKDTDSTLKSLDPEAKSYIVAIVGIPELGEKKESTEE